MITEYLMAPGTFSLRLNPSMPISDLNSLMTITSGGTVYPSAFGHVVVLDEPFTDGTVGPAARSLILALARYTGVVTEQPDPYTLNGLGLAAWLGDADHVGDCIESDLTVTGVTLSSALGTLLPAGSPITVGTVTNTGLSTVTKTWPAFTARRTAVHEACILAGAEYRINPNGTIDAALPDTLFRGVSSTNPPILVRKGTGGPESSTLDIAEGLVMASGWDAARYATKVIVVGEVDGVSLATATATASSVPWKDLHGNAVVRERLVNQPSTTSTEASAQASAELALASVRLSVGVTTSDYVRRLVAPGDYVWAFDLEGNIMGTSPVQVQGEPVLPAKERLLGISWPIGADRGVYYLPPDGTSVVDLNQWVEWESGDTQLMLGVSPAAEGLRSLGGSFEIQGRTIR